MKKLKIIIEKTVDHYSAFSENCEGIYGAGDTVEEVRKSILVAIELFKELNEDVPDILKEDYEIVYVYDMQSFLNYYNKYFSMVALEKMTGINQKQLFHYASGLKKPRTKQRNKIKNAMHKLGRDLLAIDM